MENTRLFNGLMAVLRDGNWVVISPNFDEVIRIPENEIDNPEILAELKSRDFFTVRQNEEKEPEVSLATLITTDGCNLRCLYCFANSGEGKKMRVMSDKLAFASVDRAIKNASQKKLSVAFFGGEPTLTQRLIKKVVSYARKKIENTDVIGAEFGITTNGVCSKIFLKYLVDNKFRITLSTDGVADIQNYQRPLKNGGNTSQRVDETIRYLVSRNADFKIRTTVTSYSVSQMSNTVEWLNSLGGEKIQFEPISIAGRAISHKGEDRMGRPSVDDFILNLKKAIMKGAELNVSVVNSSFMNISEPPRKFCDGNIDNRFAVSYTGDMTTCVEVQDKHHPASPEFIVGSFQEELGEFKIYNKRIIGPCSTIIGGIEKRVCEDCFAKAICGGGCPVRNFHMTGKTSIIDPYRCDIIREMLPFVIGLIDQATYGQ